MPGRARPPGERNKMVNVADILSWLDSYAPFRYGASWDNSGLQVGSPEAAADRLLVALEPSSKSLREAVERKCRCLVTHHPLLFHPLSVVRWDTYPGNLVSMAVKEEISLIAVHTNLDAAREGTNEQLSRILGLGSMEPLETEDEWKGEDRYAGMGCVGSLPQPMRLEDFASFAAGAVGCTCPRVVGNLDGMIRRVAVCSGSGGSLLDTVIGMNADLYVTGDVKYHEAMRAEEYGLALIDIGHFASERVVVGPLAEYLRSKAVRERVVLEVCTADAEVDPFLILKD